MDTLIEAFRHLSRPKKIAVAVMVLLLAATWGGVCVILASYFAA
ncbi:MAG: hypothetical protein PVI09_09325 [Anaerolineae bacterium]|jgi:hypothetical protein